MTVGTALTLHVDQIVDGALACIACEQPADFMVSTGPDPEPEPACFAHAAVEVETCAIVLRGLGARRRDSGAPAATS